MEFFGHRRGGGGQPLKIQKFTFFLGKNFQIPGGGGSGPPVPPLDPRMSHLSNCSILSVHL